MRVELDKASPLLCARKHVGEVDLVAWTLAEQSPGRMGEDVQIAVVHRPQNPLGLGVAIEIEAVPSVTGDAAASEARYFDLALLPWSKDSAVVRELAQAVVFGAGRPTILVPPGEKPAPLSHVAVAWDASRVAARALADLMPLLADDAHITALTVHDEKPLVGSGIAEALASSLEKRGFHAEALNVMLGPRTISETLQESALDAGAGLLVMGGFGHSRVRDFILGGATKGVFADLRLPVLLSH